MFDVQIFSELYFLPVVMNTFIKKQEPKLLSILYLYE